MVVVEMAPCFPLYDGVRAAPHFSLVSTYVGSSPSCKSPCPVSWLDKRMPALTPKWGWWLSPSSNQVPVGNNDVSDLTGAEPWIP